MFPYCDYTGNLSKLTSLLELLVDWSLTHSKHARLVLKARKCYGGSMYTINTPINKQDNRKRSDGQLIVERFFYKTENYINKINQFTIWKILAVNNGGLCPQISHVHNSFYITFLEYKSN